MTAPSPLFDFDDAGGVLAADVDGILRSAALGGAQIRAVAAAVDEGLLGRLTDMHPRSVVFVGTDARARSAAELVVAMFGGQAGVPLVSAPATPPWVGALDVVVVSGNDAGDPELARSIDAGLRRNAEVVVDAPDEGPVRAVSAGRAMSLPPRVRVQTRYVLARHVAVFCAVLGVLQRAVRITGVPPLAEVADTADEEAARNHPSNEVFHNPAKSLAVRMQSRRVVFAGDSAVTTVLARHASESLLQEAGVVAGAAALSDVLVARDRLTNVVTASGENYDPFFHDEELDGPAPIAPARVFVVSTDPDRSAAQRRTAALPDVELMSVIGEFESSTVPTVLEQVAVLTVRTEMAAAYLGLAGGR
ncbi:tobH protein [Rhodococcus rhodochrous]|uniref:tobH protein n=1 Tax=Rhodococcus rhodochrous TaxID=1829 RepID=UPI001E3FAD9C|nr:tobH protein [Rhodococcus rhodochrous]MCD2096892.1 tobH protein [Rhodococcus rhodochrous]MCD2121577.1 tobH protein [Rhodococcus rhodochrous]MCQ4137044.1 tobH protein [Rhodococcus rhodochrous]MDJ0018440.1 tobH protein [Rhodococcus rhodochrous]